MALNEFVQTALDEEGYEEGSDGYTKYGSWYGLANADWCVMFISWCANQAGIMTTKWQALPLCTHGILTIAEI